MRLLYVCNDFGIAPDGTKGASVHLRAITGALARLGHEVLLLSPGTGPAPGHPAERVLPPGCPKGERVTTSLRRWLENNELDCSAASELRPLMYNSLAFEAACSRLQLAPPDAVIERLALHSCLGRSLASAWNIPYVVEVNALLSEESARFRSLAMAPLAQAIERQVLLSADAVMVVSQSLATRLETLGVAAERIHIVPNGADADVFRAARASAEANREAWGLGDDLVIGFAGSMKTWHGVDDLLTAFQSLAGDYPKSRLLLVGGGPMLQSLREAARRIGLEHRIVFTGAVAHEHVPGLLAAMDIAVAPFKSLETFYFSPIKLFEYMAAGLCVVAPCLGQIEEVLTDNVNGLLYASSQPDGLTEALRRACASAALRHRLAREAECTVAGRFTWERAARNVTHIVESVRRAPRSLPPAVEGDATLNHLEEAPA